MDLSRLASSAVIAFMIIASSQVEGAQAGPSKMDPRMQEQINLINRFCDKNSRAAFIQCFKSAGQLGINAFEALKALTEKQVGKNIKSPTREGFLNNFRYGVGVGAITAACSPLYDYTTRNSANRGNPTAVEDIIKPWLKDMARCVEELHYQRYGFPLPQDFMDLTDNRYKNENGYIKNEAKILRKLQEAIGQISSRQNNIPLRKPDHIPPQERRL